MLKRHTHTRSPSSLSLSYFCYAKHHNYAKSLVMKNFALGRYIRVRKYVQEKKRSWLFFGRKPIADSRANGTSFSVGDENCEGVSKKFAGRILKRFLKIFPHLASALEILGRSNLYINFSPSQSWSLIYNKCAFSQKFLTRTLLQVDFLAYNCRKQYKDLKLNKIPANIGYK